MPVRLKNLRTSGPLVVTLTSGEYVRVSPQQTSDDLPDSEVLDNPKIEALVSDGVLAIQHSGAGGARRSRSKPAAQAADDASKKSADT